MKKLILIFFAAFCLTVGVRAADFTVGGISYTITSSTTPSTVAVASGDYSGSVNIPSSVTNNGTVYSVTSIGIMAFAGCSGLKSVSIPSSVISIEISAFAISGLTSVNIPSSVISIGNNAFEGCTSLTTVTIPSSVTSIGEEAFYSCRSLTQVSIPSSVTSIGSLVFGDCSHLISINVDPNNPNYSSMAGVLFDKPQTLLISYPIGKSGNYYTIPFSVTSIGDNAFEDCRSLTQVSIPSSITSIGWGIFNYCTGLMSINVDTSNPNYSSVDGVLFNKNQTSLLCYPSGKTGSYTLSSSVTSIGAYAFWDCSGLTSVTIPSSVTSIGNWAFYQCSSLTSLTIPSSVTSIGQDAFSMSGLTLVSIPSSVTSIGAYAFYECSGLTAIYAHNTIPANITLGFSVFYYVPVSTCVLHVPAGSKSRYAVANQWKNFTHILEDLPSAVNSVDMPTVTIRTINGQLVISELAGGEPLAVYTLQGVQLYRGIASSNSFSLALPSHGIYVVKAGAESVKVEY